MQGVFEFLRANVEGAAEANGQLTRRLLTFAEEIHIREKSVSPIEVISELSSFFAFWTNFSRLLEHEFKEISFGGKTCRELLNNMHGHNTEITEAMEKGDFVLAADLVQYELVPGIEALHEGLPRLTALLDKRSLEQDSLSKEKSSEPMKLSS